MNKFIFIQLIIFIGICLAGESEFCSMKPCSVYQLATERLFAALPQEMISQQKMVSAILTNQFEKIDLKRVENHDLIVNLAERYDAKDAVILLMQIITLQSKGSGTSLPLSDAA